MAGIGQQKELMLYNLIRWSKDRNHDSIPYLPKSEGCHKQCQPSHTGSTWQPPVTPVTTKLAPGQPCTLPITAAQHYSDVMMGAIASSQITNLTIVYSTVYSSADQISASLAFVLRIHRWPVNSPHKWPVTREMFPWKSSKVEITYPFPNFNSCTVEIWAWVSKSAPH